MRRHARSRRANNIGSSRGGMAAEINARMRRKLAGCNGAVAAWQHIALNIIIAARRRRATRGASRPLASRASSLSARSGMNKRRRHRRGERRLINERRENERAYQIKWRNGMAAKTLAALAWQKAALAASKTAAYRKYQRRHGEENGSGAMAAAGDQQWHQHESSIGSVSVANGEKYRRTGAAAANKYRRRNGESVTAWHGGGENGIISERRRSAATRASRSWRCGRRQRHLKRKMQNKAKRHRSGDSNHRRKCGGEINARHRRRTSNGGHSAQRRVSNARHHAYHARNALYIFAAIIAARAARSSPRITRARAIAVAAPTWQNMKAWRGIAASRCAKSMSAWRCNGETLARHRG